MADTSAADRAAEYRRQAASCLEVANRMSLKDDRTRTMEMAGQWLDLARDAAAKALENP